MNLFKIEHIGIAVKDLTTAIANYEQLLGVPCYKQELVASEKVLTAFFQLADSKIELLAATEPDSVIAKFIEKKGEGMHHIAYAVNNILEAMELYKNKGYQLLNEQPKQGADNKLVCFIHPKDTNGVLMELCQERS